MDIGRDFGRTSFQPLTIRTVGFDNLFDNLDALMQSSTVLDKFPPHNIVRVSDNQYIIEMAIAGIKKEDIDITVEKGVLKIESKARFESEGSVNYIYKGIGTRAFTKTFKIADSVIVCGAEFNDGILRVALENIIPDEQKPRKISIGNSISFSKPEFLKE
jgi:molecular chaperone IbpA